MGNYGVPEWMTAAQFVEAGVAGLTSPNGPQLPDLTALDTPGLVRAYLATLVGMVRTIAERPPAPVGPEYTARIHALGIISCVIARQIDGVPENKPGTHTAALFIDYGTQERVAHVAGLFDYFGILYASEVADILSRPTPSAGV
jgi:hypothetical protein